MLLKFNPLTKVSEFRLKLYPKDFAKSKEFYHKVLGYPIIKEWDRGPDDQGVMFDVGTITLELLTPEKEYQKMQGVAVSLEVNDVRKLWNSLKNHPNIIFKLRHNKWGDTSFCIADSDGFKVTFFTKD